MTSPVSKATRNIQSRPFRNGAPSVQEGLEPSGPRDSTWTGSPRSASSSTRAWRSSAGSQILVSGAMQPLPARNRLMNWSPSGGSCSGRQSHHHSPRAISSRTRGSWARTQASRSSFGSRANRCARDKAIRPGYMTPLGGERDTSLPRFPKLTGGGGRANLMEREQGGGIRDRAPSLSRQGRCNETAAGASSVSRGSGGAPPSGTPSPSGDRGSETSHRGSRRSATPDMMDK
jgi:hypothetical protein